MFRKQEELERRKLKRKEQKEIKKATPESEKDNI
jgi:hypothetical protein